jgi:hypothetical protein
VAIPPKLRSTVAKCIRQLLSDREGVIIATVSALKNLIDIHELAKHIESQVLSKDEMNKIYEEGRAQNIADVKRRQNEVINSADPDPDWTEAARLLQRFKHFFGSEQHRYFIDRMAGKTDDDDEPSRKELGYLLSLYRELKAKAKVQARIQAMTRKSK